MSLLPADYLSLYNLCDGRTSQQIADGLGLRKFTAQFHLQRLVKAGYVCRNDAGEYERAKPFDVYDVERLIRNGWD